MKGEPVNGANNSGHVVSQVSVRSCAAAFWANIKGIKTLKMSGDEM